jgi:hypothetical protein
MAHQNRFTVTIKTTERAKLRALREDYVRLATDKSYKRKVIEEARARDAAWEGIKGETRQLRFK